MINRVVLAAVALLAAGSVSSAATNSDTLSAASAPQKFKSQDESYIRLAQAGSEKDAFNEAKKTGTIEGWDAFIEKFPKGKYRSFANAYKAQLKRSAKTKPAEAAPAKPAAAPAQPAAAPATAQPAPSKEPAKKAKPVELTKRQIEVLYWQEVRDSDDIAALQSYVDQYPNGSFVPLAKLRISKLAKAQGTSAPAPEPQKPAPTETADQAAPADQPAETAVPTGVELVTGVQTELIRMQCLVGRADGKWGPASRAGLARFAKQIGIELDPLEPSADLYKELVTLDSVSCPQAAPAQTATTGTQRVQPRKRVLRKKTRQKPAVRKVKRRKVTPKKRRANKPKRKRGPTINTNRDS